jgi:D-alanyl-D-alanine carboxypeptidase (penicillin-binding protein 5/6)
MRRIRSLAVFTLSLAAAAFAPPASAAVLDTKAEHAVLMDGDTGQVLWEKDGLSPMPPASMSKLMTLELLFQRLKDHRVKLTDSFPVSERAWRERGGSEMFVNIGDRISVENLIRGIIIQSGNDACIVVAEGLGGTVENFVALMNARAKQLGFAQSHFVNPDGLPEPPGQLMSALDLAKLARHLIKDYPDLYHYFSERSFVWSNITQHNRNLVLDKFPGTDGLKTGHTDASGYGVTASAVQNGQRLILVLNGLRYPDLAARDSKAQDWFGEQRRAEEAARIFGVAFHEFRRYKLFAADDTVGEAHVWHGARDTVPLKLGRDLAVTMNPDSRPGMKVTLIYDGPVPAPIAKGQQIGTVTIEGPGFPGVTAPVYSANAVDRAGLFGRIFLGLREMFSGRSAPAQP